MGRPIAGEMRPGGSGHSPWEVMGKMRLPNVEPFLEFTRSPACLPRIPDGILAETASSPLTQNKPGAKAEDAFRADLKAMMIKIGRINRRIVLRHADPTGTVSNQTVLRC